MFEELTCAGNPINEVSLEGSLQSFLMQVVLISSSEMDDIF